MAEVKNSSHQRTVPKRNQGENIESNDSWGKVEKLSESIARSS